MAKWSIDALTKKLLDPGAFRPLLPAIFHHVAYSPDPAVIFELLRLLVLLREPYSPFPLLTRIGAVSAAGQFPPGIRGDGDGGVPAGHIRVCVSAWSCCRASTRRVFPRGDDE